MVIGALLAGLFCGVCLGFVLFCIVAVASDRNSWRRSRVREHSDPILCFVRRPWAYFTTLPLDKQWGDDWNDAPYEHNAGAPYLYNGNGEPYEVIQVAFDAPLETPADGYLNSPCSVEMINAGTVAWLYTDYYTNPPTKIMAGTPLSEFHRLIAAVGGTVYEAVQP